MRSALVVKVTAGEDAPERCAQAFTVSSVAVLSGVRVSLWLTGEAVWMAVPGRAEAFDLPHSAPLAALRDDVLTGGTLTVCTQCALRRGLGMEMRETPGGPQAAITSDAGHTLVVEFGRKASKPVETKALHWARPGMPEGQFALSAKAVPETGFMRRSLDAAAY